MQMQSDKLSVNKGEAYAEDTRYGLFRGGGRAAKVITFTKVAIFCIFFHVVSPLIKRIL